MPLIFLIPQEYSGPVVILFDQPGGIDLTPGKDGYEVKVPANGIIRVKGTYTFDNGGGYPGSSIVFLMIGKNEERTPLLEAINPWQEWDKDDRMSWLVGIRDVRGNLQKIPQSYAEGFVFDDFPESVKDKPMILWHDSCQDRVFGPDWEAYGAGEKTAEDLHIPPCGEFVVGSIERIRTWPEWMFLRGKGKTEKLRINNPAYTSIQELIDEANARVARKKAEGIS
ncbi:hypothetical protein BWP39_16480 [Paraburkholderia acidicola]|uniref:Uncharacterized protein n=1 Tax=Paraburkholderia acidicola TaxID=1912599 RepID=A0A2A4EY98_9BURK|nr:hypothetical protein BWP39_16480 [Paraburkholderia acidicola]